MLIDSIQEARLRADGLIINGAGLTYTSIAMLDALLAFGKPIIEVHMSNIYRREPFRHHSFISKAATGIVAGLGPLGYELAIAAMARLLKPRKCRMTRDALVFYSEFDDPVAWQRALRRSCRTWIFMCSRTFGEPHGGALCAGLEAPGGFFANFPISRWWSISGPGSIPWSARDDLPDVPISRLQDDGMVSLMTSFVLFSVCAMRATSRNSSAHSGGGNGTTFIRAPLSAIRVGVLGLGELGAAAAEALAARVRRYAAGRVREKSVAGVRCRAGGEALDGSWRKRILVIAAAVGRRRRAASRCA